MYESHFGLIRCLDFPELYARPPEHRHGQFEHRHGRLFPPLEYGLAQQQLDS